MINKSEIKGIKFYHRQGMSDLKTFDKGYRNSLIFYPLKAFKGL